MDCFIVDGFDDDWAVGTGFMAIPFVAFEGPMASAGEDRAAAACVTPFCGPLPVREPFCESINEPTVAPIIKGPLVPLPRPLPPLLLLALPLLPLTPFTNPATRFGDLLDGCVVAEAVDLLGEAGLEFVLVAVVAVVAVVAGATLFWLDRRLLAPSNLLFIWLLEDRYLL